MGKLTWRDQKKHEGVSKGHACPQVVMHCAYHHQTLQTSNHRLGAKSSSHDVVGAQKLQPAGTPATRQSRDMPRVWRIKSERAELAAVAPTEDLREDADTDARDAYTR